MLARRARRELLAERSSEANTKRAGGSGWAHA